jgi:hypothetical protein
LIDVEELLKRYNIPIEEVLKWGKEKHPSFVTNVRALAILYLKQTKGISLLEEKGNKFSVLNLKTVKRISELKEGEPSVIKLLVLGKIDTWTFMKCADCKKKVGKNDKVCPYCGSSNIVEVEATKYLLADDSGTIEGIAYGKAEIYEDKEYYFKGILKKRDDNNFQFSIIGVSEVEKNIDDVKRKKLITWFKIMNGSCEIDELASFLRDNNFGLTVEEAVKLIGAEIDGQKVIYKGGEQ